MTTENFQCRQGDVLIVQVPSLPEAEVIAPVGGNNLLALGETTGHAHYVPAGVSTMYAPNDALRATAREAGVVEPSLLAGAMKVEKVTMLYHGTPTITKEGPTDGDHTFIKLPPGNFLFLTPREYTGEQDDFARVLD